MNTDNRLEYEKIPSSLKEFIADERIANHLNKLDWVATEKIHGANFRFIYQGKRLFFGKRKELLDWQDDFFGFQKVAAAMESQIIALFEQLSLDFGADTIVIYGELFGGLYPHPDIAVCEHIDAIQTGIYYSPDILFCAYDIAFENGADKKTYLNYAEALTYFARFNILCAKPLKTGKLTDLLNMNLRRESRIPVDLGLPGIENNWIEGVVIKPFGQLPNEITFRPILKLKNPEFEETQMYHQAQKWSFIPNVSSLSLDLEFLLVELRYYINENRLNSAISKIGRLNPANQRQITSELLSDALADFNLQHNRILEELTEEQVEWINKRLEAEILRLVAVISFGS
ncbi:RNA ligase family protein [Dyadobacter crusticola]|uniref:RNA ligase family protein n=1 Tax=Dyadobacter crusticola TaxID=292407 RepID=UPI0004E15C91|nr:RNA ligase family protein [Dyadobacter crusticola]